MNGESRLVPRLLLGLGTACLVAAVALAGMSLRADGGTADPATPTRATLAEVRSRGHVVCGLDLRRPGFAADVGEPDGGRAAGDLQARGIEVDLCRAIAVVLFGSDEGTYAVHALDGSVTSSFASLAGGEIDIAFRSVSFSALATIGPAVRAGPVALFEPIVLLVPETGSETRRAGDDGLCVMRHTFARRAIDAAAAAGRPMPPVVDTDAAGDALGSPADLLKAFTDRRCTMIGGRGHRMEWVRMHLPENERMRLEVLDGRFHESVSAVVATGDDLWLDIVSQVIWGLLGAELEGRDSGSEPGSFKRGIWASLGLDPESGTRMIRTVGHFGEIAARHLGGAVGPNGHQLVGQGRLIAPR